MMEAEGRKVTRREFVREATAIFVAGASFSAGYHIAEQNTIPIALVGCGGRGTGAAANALSTKGPTKLVAMADVFEDRLQSSLNHLKQMFPKQVDVPPERQFLGFDAYRKAIDCVAPGGVVILATPPAFRPIHLEYAVSKGCHVFAEKSFAVDAPGHPQGFESRRGGEKEELENCYRTPHATLLAT
jgi:myo-inositol 2-dehydrogenase / D-chiro-inositol 1-dehydrogenase